MKKTGLKLAFRLNFYFLLSILVVGCVSESTPRSSIQEPISKTVKVKLNMKSAPLFISIIPHFPGQEDYLANLMIERYKKTGIDHYAMSFPIDPSGQDVMAPIKLQAQLFRAIKTRLKDQPIKLGILFQATIGHGGYWNPTPNDSLTAQRIVRLDGSKKANCCPFDAVFLQYIKNAVHLLVTEKPDFALCDDDIALSGEACCCPKHLTYISQLMGKNYTREMLAAELKTAAPFAEISKKFAAAQTASLLQLTDTIRQAIDEVNPNLPCGCCIVANMASRVEALSRSLAGKNTLPLIRINNGYYLEEAVKTQGWVNFRTGVQVSTLKNSGIRLLDESDTCPHNRFSKTARTMHLHIVSGLVRGVDGGKLWFDSGIYPLREVSLPYEEIFGRYHKFYRTIHQLAQTWKPQGIMTPIPRKEDLPYPNQGADFYVKHPFDWGGRLFSMLGVPVYTDLLPGQGIKALSGHQVDYFSDAQMSQILSGKVWLDGEAALLLSQRGFSDLLGVKAEEREYKANREIAPDGLTASFSAMDKTPFLTILPGAKSLTRIAYAHYKGETAKDIMPGCVYYKNKQGGEIITWAMTLSTWHKMNTLNPTRKLLLIKALAQFQDYPVYLSAWQHCNLFSARCPDGTEIQVVSNYSYDPLNVELAGVKNVKKVEILTPDGKFKAIKFSLSANKLKIDSTLESAEIAVFRLTY